MYVYTLLTGWCIYIYQNMFFNNIYNNIMRRTKLHIIILNIIHIPEKITSTTQSNDMTTGGIMY